MAAPVAAFITGRSSNMPGLPMVDQLSQLGNAWVLLAIIEVLGIDQCRLTHDRVELTCRGRQRDALDSPPLLAAKPPGCEIAKAMAG